MNVYNFHTYMDAKSEWRWQLVAPNGRVVADSGEGYSSLSAVREAAQRVKDNAATATID
ncbi:YegP family protein [Corallococcus sp. ZKHCc1 1396]|uniref:YegP family protein n=1 Tax=Corallococcus soli TaxID=2710757 RepID=A0ABR9Q0C3_9BACT|nr:YegP family protein [Corallococcus soli]MBE4753643.1 YegP family protein [Corallococcus soli]